MLEVILLLVATIIMEIAREVFFKLAANKTAFPQKQGQYLLKIFGSSLTWLGFAAWGIEIIIWIMVLGHLPLSIAYPIISLSYCGTIIASKYILGETISNRRWVGIFSVTIGVIIIASYNI